MDASRFEMPQKWDFVHAAIGGGICFILMSLILELAMGVLERVLIFFEILGVVVFQNQYILARSVIMFGSVYLTSGFFGGLYTGYKAEKGLLVVLATPGAVSFMALVIMTAVLGQLDPSIFGLVNTLLMPLLGNVIGAYLGGYAINWPSEEEKEEAGNLSFESEK